VNREGRERREGVEEGRESREGRERAWRVENEREGPSVVEDRNSSERRDFYFD